MNINLYIPWYNSYHLPLNDTLTPLNGKCLPFNGIYI